MRKCPDWSLTDENFEFLLEKPDWVYKRYVFFQETVS